MASVHSPSFDDRLAAAWPPRNRRNARIVVAVSGGPDSVALARALARPEPGGDAVRLLFAHFHHGLRGAEADADEQFVRDLADRLGLECRVGRAPLGSLVDRASGVEAAARKVRYAFLQATAEEVGARYVVTAHSADDQAETILHRIVRGTGLAGLAGIPRARRLGPAVTLLRPLLDVSRREILAYLAELAQPYRTDSTNASPQFTRGRIRHALLPLLAREFNPEVTAALVRLGKLAGNAQSVIEAAAAPILERALAGASGASDARGVRLACEPFLRADRHLVREVFSLVWRRQAWPLQAMGFSEWDQLAEMAANRELAASDKAVHEFPGAIRAIRSADELALVESKP